MQGEPTATPTETATPAATLTATATRTGTPLPTATPPRPTATPSCTFTQPCYVIPRLEYMTEYQGAAIVGTVLVYVLIFLFVRQSVRLLLMLSLLFALGWYIIGHDEAVLYGWVVLAALLGFLSNVFRTVGGE
jgi:hypothetical protein